MSTVSDGSDHRDPESRAASSRGHRRSLSARLQQKLASHLPFVVRPQPQKRPHPPAQSERRVEVPPTDDPPSRAQSPLPGSLLSPDDFVCTVSCEKCISLSYEQMIRPEGQLYHGNWPALVASAKDGCQLCNFFLTTQAHTEALPELDSQQVAPLVVRVKTLSSANTQRHHPVTLDLFTSDGTTRATYSLFLKGGMLILSYV